MDRILDPYEWHPLHNCFGCSPANEAGLKLEFFEDGDDVVTHWRPSRAFEGWRNVLHGGIQALLLDEICAWVVMRKLQTIGVTSKMEVKYLKPVAADDPCLTVRARVLRTVRNLAEIESCLYNSAGELCTRALCTYYDFPPERARSEREFPGCHVAGEQHG